MNPVRKRLWPFTGSKEISDFVMSDPIFKSDWEHSFNWPAVNIKELDESYEILLAAPGLTKGDFDVTFNNGILSISTEKEEEKEEEGGQYSRKEFSYHSFQRSFTLPDNADEQNITAEYNKGVLKITLKKKEVEADKKSTKIDVK